MSVIVSLSFLWIGHFIVDFMLGIWSIYKTMTFLDLGLAGTIAAVAAFAGEGAQLFFGNLSDRGYRNRILLIGIALTAANLFLVFTNSYLSILLLFVMTCIGSGAFHPTAVSFIGNLTDTQKGFYISIFSSGGALGMALSHMIFSRSYFYFKGNPLPLLFPVFLLISILLYLGYFKKIDSHQTVKVPLNFQIFKDYFYNPTKRHLYIAQVCNQTLFWGSIFLLPDVLLTRGYEEAITFGGGHFAFIIGSAFMMIPSGFLADRFSPRSVILFASGLGMVFLYFFLLSPSLPTLYLIPVLALAGAFMGIVQPLAVALGNELGKNSPGMTGFFTMGLVWCVSETIGPAGSGLISKLFIEDAPAKALMVFGLLFPIHIYFTYRLPIKEVAVEVL